LPFIKLSAIKKYNGKYLWLLIGISLIGVLGFTAFMLYGMQHISGVTGSVIMSATPPLTAILSVMFFKDMMNWKKALAIILAVSGVLVWQLGTQQQNVPNSVWGIVLVIAAICCEATYTLLGKAITKNYPPEDIAAFSAIIAFVGFIPVAAVQYRSGLFERIELKSWLELIGYRAITMGLGSVLWYKGIKQVEGSAAAAFMGNPQNRPCSLCWT
jgi:drug/metabolite transporter (DMT)-like permease